MKKRYWSQEEEVFLYNNYVIGDYSRKQIAEELVRTEGSIKAKLKQKGWVLKTPPAKPKENKKFMAEVEKLEIQQIIKHQKLLLEISQWALDFYNKNNKKPTRLDLSNQFPKTFSNYRTTIRFVLENNLSGLFSVQKESSFELFIEESLNALDYEFEKNRRFNGREVDFLIKDIGIGIEMNDTASHNSNIGFKTIEKPKDIFYHQEKTRFFFENKNIKIIHLYEKDLENYNNFLEFLDRKIKSYEKYKTVSFSKPTPFKEKYLGEEVLIYNDGASWK